VLSGLWSKQHREPESDSHLATTSIPDGIPGSPSETPLVRSLPLLTPRSLYDAPENALPLQVHRAWLKPGVWGAVIGSVLTMIVGFNWGGWTTSSTGHEVALKQG